VRNNWTLAALAVFTLTITGNLFAAVPAPKTVDEIVLVVDQDSMTKGELEEAVASLFAAQGMTAPAPGTADYQQARKEVIEGFIREVLMAEEADKEKVEIQDGDLDHSINQELDNMKKRYATEQEFEEALKKEGISQEDLRQDVHDQLLRRMKANRILQMKQRELPASVFVTDDEVQQFFNQHPKDYEQVKFSIILFRIPAKSTPAYIREVQKQAKDVLAQLKGGADFASFAKKYSQDQSSADKGGQMDPMYRVDLNPKLADGIFAIPKHSLGLVNANDGIYIVKVDEKGTADYQAVAPDIKEHLRKQKQDSSFSRWIEGLKKDAYIVEDGKVVAYQPATGVETAPPTTAAKPVATPEKTETKVEPVASNPVTQAPVAGAVPTELYPTLPNAGSFTFGLGMEGFSFGSQDLSDFYGPSIKTNQGFPFGMGLHASLDYVLDPSIHLGINVEGLWKFAETVNFSPLGQPSYSEQWAASAAGPGVEAKILIPLDESTNFVLTAGGGYYFLMGASVTVSGSAVTENAYLNGSNFGGDGSAALELFLDGNKDAAMDLEVGYRYLQIKPLTPDLTVNKGGPYTTLPTPLTNSDGSKAFLDFSGIHAGIDVRFYIDKGS